MRFHPDWRIAGFSPLFLFPQATAADVVRWLAFHPGCRAVLLTSPDYYGGCADLAEV